MTYIYLDVLLITNIYVIYFLLKGTARISHTPLTLKRCILTSLVGSLTSLSILLPPQGIVLSLLVRLACAFIIVTIAFAKIRFIRLIKLTFIFFIINFVFAGIMMFLCELLKISTIIVNNYSVYFNISLVTLCVSTIIAYTAICVMANILDRKFNNSNGYKVRVRLFGKDYNLNAICDSGNTLIDSFSGKPVIICNSKELASTADIDLNSEYNSQQYLDLFKNFKGFRLLPYSTIGNEGIIPAFLAESVSIIDEKNNSKQVDAYIGLCLNNNSEYEAIFSPRLLI